MSIVPIFTWAWWKPALIRAARTALVIAIPYAPLSVGFTLQFTHIQFVMLLSAAGLGFIASLLTSLTGIAEATGTKVKYGVAVLERVVRTSAQAALATIGTAVLFTAVNWHLLWETTAAAAFGSLVLSCLGNLPETDKLLSAVVPTTVVNNAGDAVTQSVPVVATLPVPASDLSEPVTQALPAVPAAAAAASNPTGIDALFAFNEGRSE